MDYSKWIKRLWILFGSGILSVILVFTLVSFGAFGELPDIMELENPKSSLASEVYAEDGVLLGKYYIKNRSNVNHSDINPVVFEALLATEDIRFEKHSGIDFRGLARAIFKMGQGGGASTITQQLAKNLFHEPDYSSIFARLKQKLKEWVIALRLENRYTKDEIITMYLNTVQFSGNSFGIKSAAREFFNKQPAELNREEASVLIGLLQAITKFNPRLNPENAMKRREIVLKQQEVYKFISEKQYDSLRQLPIALDYSPENHNEGPAPYFREFMKKELDAWCKQNGYNLYKDGLRIYTTINSEMQLYAEKAVGEHVIELQKSFYKSWGAKEPWRSENWQVIKNFPEMQAKKTERYRLLKLAHNKDTASIWKEMRTKVKMTIHTIEGERDTVMSPLDSVKHMVKFLHAGFMAMDPSTGKVKAWVGGINHKYFQYDHVNKSATRQVGSTFKPIVYALGIDNKISPCTRVQRIPTTFYLETGQTWTPQNSDGSSGGNYDFYWGLANSDNLITARLMQMLGEKAPYSIIEFARKLGIDSARMYPSPSICLGTADISVFEMAGAFSTFVNKGLYIQPHYITRIEDKNGNVLAEFNQPTMRQVLTEEKAYIVYKMLEGVVQYGTGQRLRYRYKYTHPTGGKTGTTQANSDGWFISVNKNLVTATWVGCDTRAVRFRSTDLGQGANTSLPIFAKFMKSITEDPKMKFDPGLVVPPELPLSPEFDCSRSNDPGTDSEGLGKNPLDFFE